MNHRFQHSGFSVSAFPPTPNSHLPTPNSQPLTLNFFSPPLIFRRTRRAMATVLSAVRTNPFYRRIAHDYGRGQCQKSRRRAAARDARRLERDRNKSKFLRRKHCLEHRRPARRRTARRNWKSRCCRTRWRSSRRWRCAANSQ